MGSIFFAVTGWLCELKMICVGDEGVDLWFKRSEGYGCGVAQVSREFLVSVLESYGMLAEKFERGEYGKPYLHGGPEFNLAHTEGCCVVAVSRGAVGVDIERMDRRVRFGELAERFYYSWERERVKRLGVLEFLRIWVVKEAVIKLAGESLAGSLGEVETFFGGARLRGREVWVAEFCEDGFVGAVAAWGERRLRYFGFAVREDERLRCHFEV